MCSGPERWAQPGRSEKQRCICRCPEAFGGLPFEMVSVKDLLPDSVSHHRESRWKTQRMKPPLLIKRETGHQPDRRGTHGWMAAESSARPVCGERLSLRLRAGGVTVGEGLASAALMRAGGPVGVCGKQGTGHPPSPPPPVGRPAVSGRRGGLKGRIPGLKDERTDESSDLTQALLPTHWLRGGSGCPLGPGLQLKPAVRSSHRLLLLLPCELRMPFTYLERLFRNQVKNTVL